MAGHLAPLHHHRGATTGVCERADRAYAVPGNGTGAGSGLAACPMMVEGEPIPIVGVEIIAVERRAVELDGPVCELAPVVKVVDGAPAVAGCQCQGMSAPANRQGTAKATQIARKGANK